MSRPNNVRSTKWLLPLLILVVSGSANKLAAQVTVSPTEVQVRVGNSAKVTITATEALTADVISWTGGGNNIEIGPTTVNGSSATTSIKAFKFSSTPIELTVTVHGTTRAVLVTTLTTVQAADFPDTPATFEVPLDVPKLIRLNNMTNVLIPPSGGLEVSSDNDSVATATTRDSTIVITGRKAGTARVTVKSNDQAIKNFDVTVREPVGTIEVDRTHINLREKQTFDLTQLTVTVRGKAQSDLSTQFPPAFSSSDTDLATVSGTTLTAKQAPKANQDRPRLKISAGSEEISIPIQIEPLATTLNVISQKNSVAVGGRETFAVDVRNSQNLPISDAQVEWTIKNEADKEFVRIASQGGTQVTVEGLSPKPTGVTLIATLKSPVTDPVLSNELTITVKDLTPSGFAPLRIRIDIVDTQTAKDLFGKKAADEFYISKIRLFNNLKNANGEFGDSILVYSESLEIRVQLEWRQRNGGSWTPLTRNEYVSLFGQPERVSIAGQPACQDAPQPNFDARYRPYHFDVVANTHDRRDERSLRSRILTVAESLSSLSSFVTAIAVPRGGSDLPLGLDKFKNLLIPSFEKLFPSMKEVQRQNIISLVIRPLEEIPFGSDVTRYLFIPKGKLVGMIPQRLYRIGAVSTTGACAEVGIIKKTGSVQ